MALKASGYLKEIVRAQHAGVPAGIPSVCSAHPYVLEACLLRGLADGTPVLIESTCNQVNQFGGYTGMTPADFRSYLGGIAGRTGFPPDRLIIGGDHLGPNVWQDEPSGPAMEKSSVLVRDYVLAGYRKIHLDASMKCADDDRTRPLPKAVSAARSADLASAAESAFVGLDQADDPPVYVIGTEVPIPGGSQDAEEMLAVTTPADLEETIEETHQAFLRRGLEAAWERVIAVVAQPGVEFGDLQVHFYDRPKARDLSKTIEAHPNLVFEGHSTDYQPRKRLRELVEDHFAVLKVGPGLTFAFREAVFALEHIEQALCAGPEDTRSELTAVIERAMTANPSHWHKHYHGSEAERRFARKYSLSDRIRYYWTVPAVHAAFETLLGNLTGREIPPGLLSQYFPAEYEAVRQGRIGTSPAELIRAHIESVFADYQDACGTGRVKTSLKRDQ